MAPSWALLDSRIYLRNDESFPTNDYTTAASATTRGDEIRVCFEFHEPPRPSRVLLCWPGMGLGGRFFFVAAHRDAVLFQVTYLTDYPTKGDVQIEFFIYRVGASSPSLDLIRPIEGERPSVTQLVRRLEGMDIAILRRGQDFAVAELEINDDAAELHVYKSSGDRWETKRPEVICHSDADMREVRWDWRTDQSFAFGSYLCWADYCTGGMFLCKVLDEDPVLEYMPLPAKLLDAFRDYHGRLLQHHHSIGVDEDHGLLKFVMIARDDGNIVNHEFLLKEHDCSNIRVLSWKCNVDDPLKWEVAGTVKPTELLYDHGLGKLPCNGLRLPVVSMADIGTVFFMCNVEKVGCPWQVFLVAISMDRNTVLYSFQNVKQEVDEDHAAGKLCFESLVAIELPKYLKLDRKRGRGMESHNTWGQINKHIYMG